MLPQTPKPPPPLHTHRTMGEEKAPLQPSITEEEEAEALVQILEIFGPMDSGAAPASADTLTVRAEDLIRMMYMPAAKIPTVRAEDNNRIMYVPTGKMVRTVLRLEEEDCNKLMAMSWPPKMPAVLSEHRCDGIKNPELRERMRRLRADCRLQLERTHAQWAVIRQQYAANGYAEKIVDVDDHGLEWIPEL
jgi:hypothetical protein